MCLSVPAKVIEIDGEYAKASVGGAITTTSIKMIDDVKVGDYILIHAGFAIQKIDESEALETLKTFAEYEEFNKQLDQEERETGERIV